MMRSPDEVSTDHGYELIEELRLNEPTEIARVRSRDAVRLRCDLRIEPGNASQRRGAPLAAQARELSRESLKLTAASSLSVGDLFWVQFDRQVLTLPDSYLLCTACRLLSDNRFEAELRFFSPVDPAKLERSPGTGA